MAKLKVAISKRDTAQEMVDEALSLLGGVDKLIKPRATVVIKPNAGHPYTPETSVNTSPAVVSAVIKAIQRAKPKTIIVAESAARGCDTLECLELSGVGKAAEEAGVDRIVDIKREKDLIRIPIRDAESAMTYVKLPRFLVEADHIVNVPIFKSHTTMVFTCALKNIKGVVQDNTHIEMHQTNLAAAMMDVWSVVRADLSIVDMIRPAEGYGPHATSPTDFGCVVAGKDPVAVDATICRMVGLDIDKVPYFKSARDRGLGHFNESRIKIVGKSIQEVFKQLWLPYLDGLEQWPEYSFYPEHSCSSCQGLIGFTMEKLKALDEYDMNAGLSIVLGYKKKLPDNVEADKLILVGDCLKKYRDKGIFVRGCPPTEILPYWCIMNRKNSDERVIPVRDQKYEEEITRRLNEHVEKLKERVRAGR